MIPTSDIETPVNKLARRKQKPSPNSENIVTKFNIIDDRLDCLQRSVASLRNDIPNSIRELVLGILREEKLRRANAQ